MDALESLESLSADTIDQQQGSSRDYLDSLKRALFQRRSVPVMPRLRDAGPVTPKVSLSTPDSVVILKEDPPAESVVSANLEGEENQASSLFHSASQPEAFYKAPAQATGRMAVAVLPAELTVSGTERVPVLLTEPLTVEALHLPAGTMLYGQVSRFSHQRVDIAITSVSFNGKVEPVNFSLHDIDGQPGIYVPETGFVALSKEVAGQAASQRLPSLDLEDPGMLAEFLSTFAGTSVQTSSRALAKAARKNRATLRAGTMCYVVPN